MQNGYVAKDENLRWNGQFCSAIRRQLRQSVQGRGMRTAEERTSSPQVDKNRSRSNLSSLGRTRPMQ